MDLTLCLAPIGLIIIVLGWIHLLLSIDDYAKWQNRNPESRRGFASWYAHKVGTVLQRELSIRGWNEPPPIELDKERGE